MRDGANMHMLQSAGASSVCYDGRLLNSDVLHFLFKTQIVLWQLMICS
jgi:hypothetical protein